jgi:hypothetical protein
MKRLVGIVASLFIATPGLLWFTSSPAAADAPAETGWWTSVNPGSTLGSPTPPPPPDVPAHGLLVEGGPDSSSPTALAAVVYQLPANAKAGQLTLTVAPNSATTPAATLELCPLSNAAVIVEYGGPMSDAPSYKCSTKVTASPSSDGKQYNFKVASVVSDDGLAVAILPTSPTDRVVLAGPDQNSLTVTQTLASGRTGSQPPTDASTSTGSSPGGNDDPGAPASNPQATVAVTPPSLPETTSAATQPEKVPTPQVAPVQPTTTSGFQANAFTPSSSHRKPLAVVLVIAVAVIGAGVWEAAGRAATRAALKRD